MYKQHLKPLLFGLSWLMVFSLALAPEPAAATELEKLLRLVDERLQVMEGVAAYKFVNEIEIENTEREQLVLLRAVSAAQNNKLDAESVESFFRLQIQLAKLVQGAWQQKWRLEGGNLRRDVAIPDLKKEIRPKLIELGDQIITQLVLALPELHKTEGASGQLILVEQSITNRFVPVVQKRELLDSLLEIRTQAPARPQLQGAPNRLTQILRKGVLRVGTTGDYRPFSFIQPDTGKLVGVDIDLAKDLAGALGVTLKLVQTSWPTLMADLAADRFDIGMSGITHTLVRQRTAFFSGRYSLGGKTPIARCDAVAKLNSLAKIDQADVRVIVNPGGTNEKYIHGHIKRAQVIVHPDNVTIFDELINKRADVMITDAIEVKVQQFAHPELCGTMPGELLTHSEKAFLMSQDMFLKDYVDGWLGEVQQSGRSQQIFDRYLQSGL